MEITEITDGCTQFALGGVEMITKSVAWLYHVLLVNAHGDGGKARGVTIASLGG